MQEKAKQLRRQGASIREISEQLGVSYQKAYYAVRDVPAPTKKGRPQSPSPIDYYDLYTWFKRGKTVAGFLRKHDMRWSAYRHYMIRDWGTSSKEGFLNNFR